MANRTVLVEVSARHVHLAQQDFETLFGKGTEMHVAKKISQPGQFAADEVVTVIGSKGQLRARLVGPARSETQVELAHSDCRAIGVEPALRVSGTLEGTPGVVLEGPQGRLVLRRGVIVAQRHLHIAPEQAHDWGIQHGDIISVRVPGVRAVTFHNVFVRSREAIDALSFMIDVDEANAAQLRGGETGELVQ